MTKNSPSVAENEIAQFSARAHEWWDPRGAFRALHDLAPLRLAYVKEQIARRGLLKKKGAQDLTGVRILDIGCGGGLMAEALAKEGAQIVGIDASVQAIDVARAHAAQSGLKIDYRNMTAEDLARTDERFEVITALEIVEHLADARSFFDAAAKLLKPGGILIIATINRTKRGYLLGVVVAEYLLGWVPPGTHDWDKFVKPSELQSLWKDRGIKASDVTGMVYKPLARRFVLQKGAPAVNYFMTGQKETGRNA